MLIIPLDATPSQIVQTTLAGTFCRFSVYQKSTGLFMDFSAANALVIAGAACLNRRRIVRDAYLGFVGDLMFADLQGSDDPVYTGLGTRWLFAWLSPADVAAMPNT
jgi:hypothetical protein